MASWRWTIAEMCATSRSSKGGGMKRGNGARCVAREEMRMGWMVTILKPAPVRRVGRGEGLDATGAVLLAR